MELGIGIAIGLALGALIGWLIARAQSGDDSSAARIAELETTVRLEKEAAERTLEAERRVWEERVAELRSNEEELKKTFENLSNKALDAASKSFIERAKVTLESYQKEARGDLDKRKQAIENLVKPVQENFEKFSKTITSMEEARREAYGALGEQVKGLMGAQEKLQAETGNLVKALRKPQVRGRWGEVQLERVAELAGMTKNCDFNTQHSVDGEDGKLRPDMVIHLPGGKNIVVDAKAPITAFLDALEAEGDEDRMAKLAAHARHVREHVKQLSSKSYWRQFPNSPEFVILFLPGESFFSAALEQDPELIERAAADRVMLATPTTLIALLHSVRYGWQQEALAESAREIADVGAELYERMAKFSDHLGRIGHHIDQSIGAYNDAVGSFDRRVLPSLKKFPELGVSVKKEISENKIVERTSRPLPAIESETEVDE